MPTVYEQSIKTEVKVPSEHVSYHHVPSYHHISAPVERSARISDAAAAEEEVVFGAPVEASYHH